MLFLDVVIVVHLMRVTLARHKSVVLSVAVLTIVWSLLVVTAVHLTVAIVWTAKLKIHHKSYYYADNG